MRIENTTLGALLELSDAQLIIIRDRWYGLNDHAPITAVYELRREKDGGFVGEGRLSTALSETRVVPVTVSRATVSELLRDLAAASMHRGTYEPLCTHTDDLPSIELAVHTHRDDGAGGIALLFTTSQGEFHAPWGACVGGELYTIPGEEIGRALHALQRPLQRHVLTEMIEETERPDDSMVSHADEAILLPEVFAALWMQGVLEMDVAIPRCAEHLRDAGHVAFTKFGSEDSQYRLLIELIEAAVKSGLLDRPSHGHVRARKPDAAAYTTEEWRHALLASLRPEPVEREVAMRDAAEWARDNLGLEFSRFRLDGHIAQGVRSAINSAIRRGEVVRHGRQIARAEICEETSDVAVAAIECSAEPRHFDGKESVLALQMSAFDNSYELLTLATCALSNLLACEGLPSGSTCWRFFVGLERPHFEGLTSWLGVSKNVPPQVVDLLQRLLEATGQRVQREYASVAHHELAPFLVVTNAGLEAPARGPVTLDDTDLSQFEVPRILRRPFVVDTARAKADAELSALLLGA